jgi:hypothetical protein
MPKAAPRKGRRTVKRDQYDEETMKDALQQVRQKNMSAYRAAVEFGVPLSTLKFRLKKPRVQLKPGQRQIVPKDVEDTLEQWMLYRSSMNHSVTRMVASLKVAMIMEKLNLTFRTGKRYPGFRWWDGFLRRHPTVSFRSPTSKETTRIEAETTEKLTNYAEKLGDVLRPLKLKREQIWNFDESKVMTEFLQSVKVLGKKGAENASVPELSISTGHISCLIFVSASGGTLPPAFVFKSAPPDNVLSKAIEGSTVVRSENGYVNSEIFVNYFDLCIEKFPKARPLLLLIDGHSSHMSVEFLEKARENDIHVFCFPSHLTHKLQPLDVGLFGPVRQSYTTSVNEYLAKNPQQKKLEPKKIIELYCNALTKVFTKENIEQSFQKTGIRPYNKQKIINFASKESVVSKSSSSEKTFTMEELKYLFEDPEPEKESDEEKELEEPPQTTQQTEKKKAKLPKSLGNTLLTEDGIIKFRKQQEEEKKKKKEEADQKRKIREENKQKKIEDKVHKQIRKQKKVMSLPLILLTTLGAGKNRRDTKRNKGVAGNGPVWEMQRMVHITPTIRH